MRTEMRVNGAVSEVLLASEGVSDSASGWT